MSRNEERFNPPAACGIQRSHARQKSKLSKEYKLQNSKKNKQAVRMCPRLSLCSCPGICQANFVDVQRSMATQGKIPLAARETSEKEIKCNEHVKLRDLTIELYQNSTTSH